MGTYRLGNSYAPTQQFSSIENASFIRGVCLYIIIFRVFSGSFDDWCLLDPSLKIYDFETSEDQLETKLPEVINHELKVNTPIVTLGVEAPGQKFTGLYVSIFKGPQAMLFYRTLALGLLFSVVFTSRAFASPLILLFIEALPWQKWYHVPALLLR